MYVEKAEKGNLWKLVSFFINILLHMHERNGQENGKGKGENIFYLLCGRIVVRSCGGAGYTRPARWASPCGQCTGEKDEGEREREREREREMKEKRRG